MFTKPKHIALCISLLLWGVFAIAQKSPKDSAKIYDLYARVKTEFKTDTGKAFSTMRMAFELAQKANYLRAIQDGYNLHGRMYRLTGNYDKAISLYTKGLAICDTVRDWQPISGFYNNLGTAYLKKGNNKLAIDYFMRSLRVSAGKVDPIEDAPTENNIGLIYMDLGQREKALEYFNHALETFKKAGDNVAAAGTYSNIGGVYYDQKDQKKALGYFKLALQAYMSAGDSAGVGLACINIADIHSELRQYNEAKQMLKRAYKQLEIANDMPNMVYALAGLANAANGQGEHKEAEGYLKLALDYSKQMHSINNEEEMYLELAQTNAKMNNYKDAYDNLTKYAALKDTLHKQDAIKQITELNAKYEDEKKNKTIELLKKEKEIANLNKLEEERSHAVMRNYLLASVIVVLLIAGLVFARYRTKQKANILLERKNKDIEQQKELIENKNSELAEKNKEITDGIHYAKRIQMALLTSDKYISKHINNYFILYKPKDIVSGDFYWGLKLNEHFYFVVADCTGHGVPGAFMSMIGINLLNEIIMQRKCSNPGLILDIMREEVMRNLNGEDAEIESRDGMDMVLGKLNTETRQLEFAAANNSLYVYRKKEQIFTEYKGDKMPVGKHIDMVDSFSKHTLQLEEGDTIYTFTDGYPDQFGGPKGKKFKYKQLEEVLQKNIHLSMQEQSQQLNAIFADWKGKLEQVDDVCIMGIRV